MQSSGATPRRDTLLAESGARMRCAESAICLCKPVGMYVSAVWAEKRATGPEE
jgi:hypothetical protein